MSDPCRIAILIVSYNSREDISPCLESVLANCEDSIIQRIVVIDNASHDGSADYIEEHFPQVELVRSRENLGFAGGNNLGWSHIQETGEPVDHLVLLNPDTIVEANWLRPMAQCLHDHSNVGIVQAKLRLHPRIHAINSAGNRCHYLGFGFVTGLGEEDTGQYDEVRPIHFASGAACMVRTDLLQRFGLFEPEMFLYLEDADLSWKLRQAGFEAWVVPQSIVYHKYRFDKNFRFYYYFERNRLLLLLTYYKAATLLAILPMLLFMELGQLLFAALQGWDVLRQKLKSYVYFCRPAGWKLIRRRRKQADMRRRITDREFLRDFEGAIDFPELQHPLLRYVANPILSTYWRCLKVIMIW